MDAQYARQGPTSSAYLVREHARDLDDVIAVVRNPRGQQLSQRHRSERRMLACAIEVTIGHAQLLELCQAVPAQQGELVEQTRHRAPARSVELRKSIEWFEATRIALAQD